MDARARFGKAARWYALLLALLFLIVAVFARSVVSKLLAASLAVAAVGVALAIR